MVTVNPASVEDCWLEINLPNSTLRQLLASDNVLIYYGVRFLAKPEADNET